jgi:hypothetical protein
MEEALDRGGCKRVEASAGRLRAANVIGAWARFVPAGRGCSQAEFAARYRTPVGTPRDVEQGRRGLDATAVALFRMIAHDPHGVARTLAVAAPGPGPGPGPPKG